MAGMKFLERSRSQRDKEPTPRGRKVEKSQEQDEPKKPKRAASKRKSIFPFAMSTPAVAPAPAYTPKTTTVPTTTFNSRPTSVNSRKSFRRPRTADGQDPCEQMPVPFDTMDIKAGDDTFSFPTPSPRLPGKSGTFQAAPSPLTLGEPSPQVGIALGSPTNAPQWGRTHTVDHISRTLSQRPNPVTSRTWAALDSIPEPPKQQLKKSKSAWKTLGGLFKSKQSRQPIPEKYYQVNNSPRQLGRTPPHQNVGRVGVLDSVTSSPAAGLASPASITSHHSRTPSHSRGMARFEARAEADRVSFMATIDSKMTRGTSQAPPGMSVFSPPQPAHRSRHSESGRSENVFKTSGRNQNNDSNAPKVPAAIPWTPKLEMDFPSAELDRYSVMFEKLLEPKPSLLERRQSKLNRLNSVKKDGAGNALVPQRSLTSPHLSRMPSLSIKVAGKPDPEPKKQTQQPAPQQSQVSVFHRPRPIKRSATAPSLAISPVTARFAPTASHRAPSPESPSASSPLYGENSLPPTPTTINDSDSLTVFSSHDNAPIIPRIEHPEPAWEMLTSSAPEKETDARYLRVKSPEDLERQIVQVSVARQVSVSKARRQVQNASEVKQPLRPRVVELGKNRKSTLVLIESDD